MRCVYQGDLLNKPVSVSLISFQKAATYNCYQSTLCKINILFRPFAYFLLIITCSPAYTIHSLCLSSISHQVYVCKLIFEEITALIVSNSIFCEKYNLLSVRSRHQHNVSRSRGYLDFYTKTKELRRIPFMAVSTGKVFWKEKSNVW